MKKLLFLSFLIITGFKPDQDKIQVFLIGDSTLANKAPGDAPETGWGMVFQEFFTDKIKVENHAQNGRSTKSFINEGRWAKVTKNLKSGDWVLIQFGHNDSKDKDTSRYAAANTDYKKNLIRFINETRAKGGNPVLITPVMRRRFDEKGTFFDTHGNYPAAVKAVAKEQKVPMIDLHALSQEVIVQHGLEGSKALFMHVEAGHYPKFPKGLVDDTHFTVYGAKIMAGLVAKSVHELDLDLKKHLKHFGDTDKFVYDLPVVQQPSFRKDTFNVISYGAKNDGLVLNSAAINKAIEACAEKGGGTVLIPEGFWLSGPITLKSNINLHLAKGALLQFSDNYKDYPLVKTNWEGLDAIRCQSPVSATDAVNIAITGGGIIDGAGQAWRSVKKEKLTDSQWQKLVASGGVLDQAQRIWYPSEGSKLGNTTPGAGNIAAGYTMETVTKFQEYLRPNMIRFSNCKKILLEGVTFQNSPAWNLHPMLCDHITLKNLTVRNPWYAQNGDGVDLESCRFALIDNCTFDVGDDGICIKSGRDEEGRKRGVPTENVIVQNSTVFHGHGGFVIGSEMSGGVKNLFINNCNFLGTDVGLRFKTARGRGGVVENIFISNINMTNIPGEAILFDMYYMAKDPVPKAGEKNELPVMKAEPVNAGTPQFQNFNIRNIVCKRAETAIMVRGLPEMSIKNITIENAVLQSNKGFVCIEGENINLKNVSFFTKDKTVMQIQNSTNVTMDKISYADDRDLLLKVIGDRSKGIRLLNTDDKKAKKNIEFSGNASSKALTRN
ncbi:glycosyl hydrolase family 28 protein [Dyadobacter sp. CY345]|uniref:glycosyl hydrolase family 28 protein n=1 Tax=Dyadobacter sp. CY345 TaxID=2909335 RepID=UPI001F27FA45|nr:glycosyl hydrolase family 28 protein [Dyadobacter sp. CY345]MCF2444520.1 glycosyl hydrolase family 28 protein [Dyadobacter sp. CY345]